MGFEESLVRNAAPTLAGIKVANLYNFKFESLEQCLESIECYNRQLNSRGIFIELMKNEKDFYLLYVYRKNQLVRILQDKDTRDFLEKFGYNFNDSDITCFIDFLKYRIMSDSSFPHEIGVFLGYPLNDVIDFINQKGEGSLCCGTWKVYHDAQNAMAFFNKLKKCKDVYINIYLNGRSLYDMTVNS